MRSSLLRRTNQTAFHHPGIEERPDEFEHALIRQPRRDARHQAVVVDTVEKPFEIDINHNAVALGDIALRLSYRLMSGTSRPEAVTVLGKRLVPPLLKNLQQSLLDQPVDDARDTEFSGPRRPVWVFPPV